VRGSPIFTSDFFGETPSQKTPDTGLTSIRVAKLGNAYARQRNVKFVIGSSLNAGFISGSPRYNYGKTSWSIPRQYIEKRKKLRAVAAQFGTDLRTAALQFSAAPDVAAALIVGAHTEAQVLANVSSMQATIPPEFWAELKRHNLIEQNAPTPTIFDNRVQLIQGRGT
jgi:D-threo-aldose 1-dehydrogenase